MLGQQEAELKARFEPAQFRLSQVYSKKRERMNPNHKNSTGQFSTVLSAMDVELIIEAKIERARLRREAAELSDRVLARKFGVSQNTISRIRV